MTLRGTFRIGGEKVTLPIEPGHTCTAKQAQMLTQVYAENIYNWTRSGKMRLEDFEASQEKEE